jgi:uncharacterized protein
LTAVDHTVDVDEARPGMPAADRMLTETRVARVAIGLIALHVADDNFLQPQPGTNARDHLVSGLVPLTALAIVGWTYPRRRAGVRATLALVVGSFGVVAGIEAIHYSLNGGPSGDDYSGFVSIAAGLALLSTGLVTLWRTRRRDDSRKRRYLRRLVLTLLALASVYLLLVPFYVSYVFTHAARAFVPAAELGAPHESVSFATSDGLELKGWYIPSRNRAAVIAFPGRKGPQRQARMLARHGYGVLLFDRRGEGESDGDPNIFGWAGDRDLKAAVTYLQSRPDVDARRIGGIGLSVGGEMLLEAAAESDGINAVVSEGAGVRSIRESLAMADTRKRLEGSIAHAILTPGLALFSNTMPPPSLDDLVGRIAPRPVFFIYAVPGQGGEAELTERFYKAAGAPKAIWRVPGSEHTGGIEARPAEYERRVVAFFDRALLSR